MRRQHGSRKVLHTLLRNHTTGKRIPLWGHGHLRGVKKVMNMDPLLATAEKGATLTCEIIVELLWPLWTCETSVKSTSAATFRQEYHIR